MTAPSLTTPKTAFSPFARSSVSSAPVEVARRALTLAFVHRGRNDRGAVVFLQLADGIDADSGAAGAPAQACCFESRQSHFNPDCINTSRKSWLPIDASSEKSIAASPDSTGDSEPKFINIGPVESSAEPSELTLEYLRSRIDAIADMLAEGEGVEGYGECVAFKFASANQPRAIEKVEGKPYVPNTVREGPFASGPPSGSEFRSSRTAGAGCIRH